jgi:hypothetical protein
MLGWTDLKLEIAVCWKVSWKVDPLPFRVPLRLELLADADPLPVVAGALLVDEELDEEHAARATAQTASPAVVTCRLGRRCISGTPYRDYGFWAAASSPVILQTVVCQYSLPASQVLASKCKMDSRRLES